MKLKKLCLAGKNRIAIETLDFLKKTGNFDILACPVESDNGIDSWQPSLKRHATELSVPIVRIEEIYNCKDLIFLSVEFDKIIDIEKFNSSELLNIHFSLLPAYKGCFTSVWPIYFGEHQTGVTLHYIDSGIDTGDIVDQLIIPISSELNARELYEKYQDFGRDLIEANIDKITLGGGDYRICQTAIGSSYFSRKSLSKIEFEINGWATASQIKNKVRSIYFPEYQTAKFNGVQVKNCTISESRSTKMPGSILEETRAWIMISTIDYNIILFKHTAE